jgi:hypothetical protein
MPTKIAVVTGATPTLVSAARERQLLVVQNQGSVDVFIGFDRTASSVTVDTGSFPGQRISPGETFGFAADVVHPVQAFSGGIYAVHGSGSTQNLSLQEI